MAHRISAAAVLFLSGLLFVSAILSDVTRTVPVQFHAAEHGGTVELLIDNVNVFTSADCVTVNWRAEQIRAIELGERGVIGAGTRPSCDETVDLHVIYQDGFENTYSFPKQPQIASPVIRALIVAAILAFALALIVSGLPSALAAKIRASKLGRALGARLPMLAERSEKRLSTAILFAVVLVVLTGTAVRAYYLQMALAYDESWTYVDFASQPIQTIVTDYHSTNNHIFHTLLAHESTVIFGPSPWSLRLPAFFAGILLIAATFAVGRQLYGTRAGLLAAALTAGSTWLIEFSAQARGYGLVALDCLLLLLLAGRLRHRSKAGYWLGFALLGALGMYIIPSMAYALVLVCGWLGLSILIENRGRRRWMLLRNMTLSVLLLLLITALLYLPPYIYVRTHSDLDIQSFAPVSWTTFVQINQSEWSDVWASMQRDLSDGAAALLMVGFAASMIFHSRLTFARIPLLVAALLWLPAVLFIQLVTNYDRVWLFFAPLYLILASSGLLYLWALIAGRHLWPRTGAIAVLAIIIAVSTAGERIQTGSVEAGSDSLRPAGAEIVMRWLQDNVSEPSTIVCVIRCRIFDAYGMMYGITLFSSYEDVSPSPNSLYAVTFSDRPINVEDTLVEANIPLDQFTVTVATKAGKVTLFKLDRVDRLQ